MVSFFLLSYMEHWSSYQNDNKNCNKDCYKYIAIKGQIQMSFIELVIFIFNQLNATYK